MRVIGFEGWINTLNWDNSCKMQVPKWIWDIMITIMMFISLLMLFDQVAMAICQRISKYNITKKYLLNIGLDTQRL